MQQRWEPKCRVPWAKEPRWLPAQQAGTGASPRKQLGSPPPGTCALKQHQLHLSGLAWPFEPLTPLWTRTAGTGSLLKIRGTATRCGLIWIVHSEPSLQPSSPFLQRRRSSLRGTARPSGRDNKGGKWQENQVEVSTAGRAPSLEGGGMDRTRQASRSAPSAGSSAAMIT